MATPEERQVIAEEFFNSMDANADGDVSLAELVASCRASGRFSTEERVVEECNKTMAEADANKDGKISKAEWVVFFEKMWFTEPAP